MRKVCYIGHFMQIFFSPNFSNFLQNWYDIKSIYRQQSISPSHCVFLIMLLYICRDMSNRAWSNKIRITKQHIDYIDITNQTLSFFVLYIPCSLLMTQKRYIIILFYLCIFGRCALSSNIWIPTTVLNQAVLWTGKVLCVFVCASITNLLPIFSFYYPHLN